jgi:asparagine synthase (glutamine-hydrolysing)
MCGIAGAVTLGSSQPIDREGVAAMIRRMISRGPDGHGLWEDETAAAVLAHRRLAIIELTPLGAQPMHSHDQRFVVTFNGEIYNFAALREELVQRGAVLRSHSDTEVLLELYARDGVAMLPRLRGMFAFGIWDRLEQTLLLARDCFGMKPLYVADNGRRLLFASQVRALLEYPGVDRTADPAAVAAFRLWGSIPEPRTLFKEISALPAGHSMMVRRGRVERPQPFLTLEDLVVQGQAAPRVDPAVALRDSVAHHLVADVEVGCFLSAGVDSSALLALMRDCGQSQVRAITLDFEEFRGTENFEADMAGAMAARYGATHEVHTITRADFEGAENDILEAMDQPSIDGVNTWFVARAARRMGLKVALSGLGADELMAGYSTFDTVPQTMRWTRNARRVPGGMAVVRLAWPMVARHFFPEQPKARYIFEHGDSLESAYLLRRCLVPPSALRALTTDPLVREGLSQLHEEDRLRGLTSGGRLSALHDIALLESGQYMRNQLLRDTDWAGMAHALEIRTPFVDTALWRALAPEMNSYRGRRGKAMLAAAPSLPIPAAVVERPKSGFGIPVDRWTGAASGRPDLTTWADRVLHAYGQATKLDLAR